MISNTLIGYFLLLLVAALLVLILSPEWLLKKIINSMLANIVSIFILAPYLLALQLLGISPQSVYTWLSHHFHDENTLKIVVFFIIAMHFVVIRYIANKLTQ